MAYLNINIPILECFVRGEYLRNLEDSHGTYFPCRIFGAASIPGKVPLFHFLMEDGGLWWRMPISAFCWKEADHQELDDLVLWDSMSYNMSCTRFSALSLLRMSYFTRRKVELEGTYLFTLDWANEDPNIAPVGFSELPNQSKCGHVIKLDNGNYAIQPNNRVRIHDPSFCVKTDQLVIERKLNKNEWNFTSKDKWIAEDDDKYYYDIENKK